MKIAGVSIKKGHLLDKEQLIKLALVSPKYNGRRNAIDLINKEITESGLYNENKPKSKKPKTKRSKVNRGPNNNKQS